MIDLRKIIPSDFDGSDIGKRENLKIEGSKEYKSANDINAKVNGIIKIMYSHYCRSYEASRKNINHPKKFEDYAGHWLWAEMGQIIDDINIKNILTDTYPYPQKSRIAKGESYYR